MSPRPCPQCHAPTLLREDGHCAACQGRWWRAPDVDALCPGQLGPLRRLVGKGPLTPLNCPDCRMALKSLDVPGSQYEGDLFWGLESARPSGTCVAHGCARCGGVWVDAENLARSHGGFADNLAAVMRGAS